MSRTKVGVAGKTTRETNDMAHGHGSEHALCGGKRQSQAFGLDPERNIWYRISKKWLKSLLEIYFVDIIN